MVAKAEVRAGVVMAAEAREEGAREEEARVAGASGRQRHRASHRPPRAELPAAGLGREPRGLQDCLADTRAGPAHLGVVQLVSPAESSA